MKRIGFDPGIPLLQLVDAVDDPAGKGADPRALELSRAAGFVSIGVPFKHLVVVAQAAAFDVGKTVEILRRTGYPPASEQAVAGRMEYARRWLDSFAPEEMKFTVQPSLPVEARELEPVQREFLGRLSSRLDVGMNGERIHHLIYGLAGEFAEVKPAALFRAIYLALLGKPRGPRAGEFIALLGTEFCAARFAEASGGDS
jgi:lysyl-tRNA synthetase class 1